MAEIRVRFGERMHGGSACARGVLAVCLLSALASCARQVPPEQRAVIGALASPVPRPIPARDAGAALDAASGGSAASAEIRIGVNGELPGTDVPATVARQLAAAGSTPVRMHPGGPDVQSIDGLVMVGGADIDPARYGEARDRHTQLIGEARERFDLDLAHEALTRHVPVLGICLGAQELWVSAQGSLVQDIPSEVGSSVDHRARATGHWVSLAVGSELRLIYGADRLLVYSNHHQAVDGASRNPPEFVISARASDGVVEGFEASERRTFVIGVNWHPEQKPEEVVLFRALVQASADRKRAQLQGGVLGR